jgi:protein-tyrosine-phosphatase
MDAQVVVRAGRFAALGDPARLAIVDELGRSDRASIELQAIVDLPSNLLAHHLDVLERVGLITRHRSSGDGRRRYVHLEPSAIAQLAPLSGLMAVRALFVCTHNSARSQLAAALWEARTGQRAQSAGTHPAANIHPGAVSAARRAHLALAEITPQRLDEITSMPPLVVTVCDRAHEELEPPATWLHWSIPDPVAVGTKAAFDLAVRELDERITAFAGQAAS